MQSAKGRPMTKEPRITIVLELLTA